MEVSEYDEYHPERELDKNFKIPRKRTAEDSFGPQAGEAYAEYYAQAAQAAQLQYSQAQAAAAYAQYATLSGAASQATAYTNSKPPVQYSVPKQAKIDTSIQPPLPPSYATGNAPPNANYSSQAMKHEIAAPNTNPYAPLITSTTSSQSNVKALPGKNWGGAQNRNWGGGNMGGDSKSIGGNNRSWGMGSGNAGGNRNWGGGQTRNWGGTDSNTSQGGGPSRNWGGSQNRSWGGGLSESSSFNSGTAGGGGRGYGSKTDRSWDNPYDDEPMSGNSDRAGGRSWGDNSGRNWGGGNSSSFGRGGDDFASGGGNRWNTRETRDSFGSGSGDYDYVGGSGLFGGRGRGIGSPLGRGGGMEPPVGRGMSWRGRGGNNSLGGKSLGLDNEFGDADGYEERRGFGIRKLNWNQKDFGSDSFDTKQQDFGGNRRGGFAGRGWGGRGGQDRRGRGRGGGSWGGTTSSTFGGAGKPPGASSFGQRQRPKERPKNIEKAYGGPVNIPDLNDESLPKDLRMMFQPLYCKLCQLQMSSNIMAKMHYKSKNHEKKIRKYLSEHSLKTGEQLHPRAKVVETTEKKKDVVEVEKDPKSFHCDICDLPLTGKLHAESHYMGRNHNAVVMGKKQPSGKGHYDENGKWVRDKTEKAVLEKADDTFGLAFRKKENGATDTDNADAEKKPFEGGEFSCSLCCVTCTCQEQISAHFNGAKHKKKLKQLGISPESFEPPKEGETVGEGKTTASQDDDDEGSAERNDFSRYKTPSGNYYCEKCNLAVNSEVQLKQHLESKNHVKKLSKKAEPVANTAVTA